MEITVNGVVQSIAAAEPDLLSVLKSNKIEDPQMVAVQLNGQFIESSQYAETILSEGDVVEFLYFMGGGSR
ncbi:sulfur carrier protein ThiS [bacterium BMS3Bbin14]|nr:sulfur carrier protein ThiS [bacterium BMS3Abin13]GBE52706.1 sulfur carrier protein ThiS [bacterium BMS3Bbin14]HDK43701.1 sulfur carrier protein ThiS [Desulfobacteraceae bacterium]HDL98355.1 sulfur carrier protein ThiS [Desulfobacteraceae bacterium]HDO29942.1 sulfur carrier protein ThiS [Desulfobacteraceae bacterium]